MKSIALSFTRRTVLGAAVASLAIAHWLKPQRTRQRIGEQHTCAYGSRSRITISRQTMCRDPTAQDEFLQAATAQNLRKLAKLVTQSEPPAMPAV